MVEITTEDLMLAATGLGTIVVLAGLGMLAVYFINKKNRD